MQVYFLSIDLCSTVMFVHGKSILYILFSIKFLLLPVPILYLCVSAFFDYFFSFVIITDLVLWKLKIFYLTISDSFVVKSVSSATWHLL